METCLLRTQDHLGNAATAVHKPDSMAVLIHLRCGGEETADSQTGIPGDTPFQEGNRCACVCVFALLYPKRVAGSR